MKNFSREGFTAGPKNVSSFQKVQAGFRKGKSTLDNVLVTEVARKMGISTGETFCRISRSKKKSFRGSSHFVSEVKQVWSFLSNVKLIRESIWRNRVLGVDSHGLSQVCGKPGTKGGLLSVSVLFFLFVADHPAWLKANGQDSMVLGLERFTYLQFTDDSILFADSKKDFQELLRWELILRKRKC